VGEGEAGVEELGEGDLEGGEAGHHQEADPDQGAE